MDFWKNKNVLVTGADGFIGSWIALALIQRNANVTTIARDEKKESNLDILDIRKKINIVRGDITDYETVFRAMNEYEIDTCFHLAAQAIVGIAEKGPFSTFESNIKGTWVLLEAAKNAGIKRMVIASSDKAYGEQEKLPYDETQPLLARNPYDASKTCADILAQTYFSTYKLPVAITRNANTYGPADMNLNRIIPGTIKSVLFNEIPIIRSDGSPERDYMYIEDAVSAYLSVAENLDKPGIAGEAFNFGTGKPVKVIEVYDKIIKLCGKDVKPKILGQAKNEIDRQYLSSEKAKKLLKWEYKWELDEGLKKTVEWYKNYWRV